MGPKSTSPPNLPKPDYGSSCQPGLLTSKEHAGSCGRRDKVLEDTSTSECVRWSVSKPGESEAVGQDCGTGAAVPQVFSPGVYSKDLLCKIWCPLPFTGLQRDAESNRSHVIVILLRFGLVAIKDLTYYSPSIPIKGTLSEIQQVVCARPIPEV